MNSKVKMSRVLFVNKSYRKGSNLMKILMKISMTSRGLIQAHKVALDPNMVYRMQYKQLSGFEILYKSIYIWFDMF